MPTSRIGRSKAVQILHDLNFGLKRQIMRPLHNALGSAKPRHAVFRCRFLLRIAREPQGQHKPSLKHAEPHQPERRFNIPGANDRHCLLP